jgi:uncharacterized protein (TIGR00297 family)
MATRLLSGVLLGILVALAARRVRLLTPGGAVAAALVGGLVFAGGGVSWAILLLLFFASSSALSHLSHTGSSYAAKGGTRDTAQVLANGLIPAIAAGVALIHSSPSVATVFAASVAAATADTWASELGRTSPSLPRDILTWRSVAPGVSGGITALGTVASVAGSFAIAVSSGVLLVLPIATVVLVGMIGLLASIVDSVLGATLQEVRFCPHCAVETEQRLHRACGTMTSVVRGVPGLNNDWVNLLASASAGVGAVLGLLISSH